MKKWPSLKSNQVWLWNSVFFTTPLSESKSHEHVCLLNHQKTHQTLIFCSLPTKKRDYIQYTRLYPSIPVNIRHTRKYPKIHENTRKYTKIPENTRKYPTYPEIPGSKKDTRKYPIVYFDTPTRPEPNPLPGILSNTRPDPTRYWKILPVGHCLRRSKKSSPTPHCEGTVCQ